MRATLLTVAALAIAGAAHGQLPSLNAFQVLPGQAQGGRGDLVRIPAGTVEGVHVIQGGSVECLNPSQRPPCALRPRSWNLDVGSGDGGAHRGDLGFNYDVGRCIKLFDGRTHPSIVVCTSVDHTHPVIDLYGDVRVHGRLHRVR